jgi:hypothetical protein
MQRESAVDQLKDRIGTLRSGPPASSQRRPGRRALAPTRSAQVDATGMTGTPKPCTVCGVRPPAMREIPYCFTCWPGGPVAPPPCYRCGSTANYYTSGLCARRHPRAGRSRLCGSSAGRWRSFTSSSTPALTATLGACAATSQCYYVLVVSIAE